MKFISIIVFILKYTGLYMLRARLTECCSNDNGSPPLPDTPIWMNVIEFFCWNTILNIYFCDGYLLFWETR